MKKLVASALLAGLFLGTASPVFATETNKTITVENGSTTPGSDQPVTSVGGTISTNYTVTIPSELSINLMDPNADGLSEGTVELTELTSAGKILVTPTVKDLQLISGTGTGIANETLAATLINADENAGAVNLTSFNLTNNGSVIKETQAIKIKTTEENKDNRPGSYAGSITFTLKYIEALPTSSTVPSE